MSQETLLLFLELMDHVTLNVGAPDFEESAIRVLTAKRELHAALGAFEGPPNG